MIEESVKHVEFQMKFISDGIARSESCTEPSFVKLFQEKEGASYVREELMQIVLDLLSAGSETSATTLHWALLLLANNPEIQSRLRQEIESVVPAERYPSLDDMAKLPYVEAAILELMRLTTLLPYSILHSAIADTEVGGFFVPVNTKVFVVLYSS